MASTGWVGGREIRTGEVVKYHDGKKTVDAVVIDVQAPAEGLLHLRLPDGEVVKNVPQGSKTVDRSWY